MDVDAPGSKEEASVNKTGTWPFYGKDVVFQPWRKKNPISRNAMGKPILSSKSRIVQKVIE
ncbi:MAG: hypothetical protein WCQ66_03120 [Sphaerochaetaceae bacterium]|jgi:hypothetical protein